MVSKRSLSSSHGGRISNSRARPPQVMVSEGVAPPGRAVIAASTSGPPLYWPGSDEEYNEEYDERTQTD
jgi:hypothetical protein